MRTHSMLVTRCCRWLALAGLAALSSTALAQSFPPYYPASFQRSGHLDAVHLDEQRIVVNDTPYRLADNVVIHALSSYSVPATRLRPGQAIAFRTSRDRQILQIWLLPDGYDARGRRGR